MLIDGSELHSKDTGSLIGQLRDLHSGFDLPGQADKTSAVNPDAWRVEQGEMGFSSRQPIGTDNIDSCVAVVLHDPVTHKTGLAHVDALNASQSLQLMLSRMPATTEPLKVRLVGARHGQNKTISSIVGQKNVNKVIEFLKDKHVDIVSAALYDKEQPTSLVVDPVTFKMTDDVPGKDNPDRHIATAKTIFAEKRTPLHLAFDLTLSKHRAPLLFTEEEKQNFSERFTDDSENNIRHWFIQNRHYGPDELNTIVHSVTTLAAESCKSVDHMLSALNRKIAALEEQGLHVARADKQRAGFILREKGLHIGAGAGEGNQPLLQFIEDKLFTPQANGTCSTDLDALAKFQFAQQPYDIIETGVRGTSSFQSMLSRQQAGEKDEHALV